MNFYQFQALSNSGEKILGTISANNQDQALQNLKNRGLYPIRLSLQNYKFLNRDSIRWTIEWSRDMSFFLKQGLSLSQSLEMSKLRLKKSQKQFIDVVISELHTGLTLSQIFSKHSIFSKFFISLLSISEATGQYAQAFEDYALIKNEETDFFKKLKSSLQYPLILGIILFVTIILFCDFLLPVALDFFAQNNFEQHQTTRLFIDFAIAIKHIFLFFTDLSTLSIILGGVYFALKINSFRIFLSWFSLVCPLFGPIYLLSLQYFYLKSFSMLLKRGYHVTQSTEYCAEALKNIYLQKRTQKISRNIKIHGKISKAIAKELQLPILIQHLLLTGENTSQLPLYSDICAQSLKNIYQYKLQKIIAWTGPILISIMGIIMIWMVIAFVVPLYDQIARLD